MHACVHACGTTDHACKHVCMHAITMSAGMCVSDHACGGGSHVCMFACMASAGLKFFEGFGSFASLGAVRNLES